MSAGQKRACAFVGKFPRFVLFVAILGVAAHAATYYVSTTGSNSNAGSQVAPFRTISYAYSQVVAGDTILVQPGTYTDSHNSPGYGILLNKAGTAAKPIIIKSVVPRGAIIDEQQDPIRKRAIYVEDASYNIVDGFRITNSWRFGIVVYGNNNTFQNNEIDHCGLDTIPAENEHGAIYIAPSSANCKILSNYIHDIGPWPEHASSTMNITADGFLVANNIISARQPSMYGIQIAPEAGMIVTNGKIYNNTFINNPAAAIVLYTYGGTFSGLEIANNIMANNGGSINLCEATGSGVVANSNIDYNNFRPSWVDVCVPPPATVAHTDINWIMSNPLFVSATDYHLQSGSRAIGAGLTLSSVTMDFDGNARSAGTAYDIGAYQMPKATAVLSSVSGIKSFSCITTTSSIKYTLPKPCFVSIKYYDLQGRIECSFVNNYQQAGNYSLKLPGASLGRNVYILKFQAGDFVKKERLAVSK
ncbi:MAG: right-handed parallel beta-helix repeat-containing protein [Chitinivibrionales bacterium]|nr:right-handed parallel beta-helix repeat-containing protein [Chitinivibrionales bacterium]